MKDKELSKKLLSRIESLESLAIALLDEARSLKVQFIEIEGLLPPSSNPITQVAIEKMLADRKKVKYRFKKKIS